MVDGVGKIIVRICYGLKLLWSWSWSWCDTLNFSDIVSLKLVVKT